MKKNIMLLIGHLGNGGAERSIINLANSLSLKHNVVLVTSNIKTLDYRCNVKIIEIKEFEHRTSKFKAIKKLKKLKLKYNIDTTISYTTAYNFFNVITKCHDKIIISIRNHLSTKKESLISRIMHRYTIKKCDLMVCCSMSVRNDQINYYHADKRKIKVITNFSDRDFIESEMNKKIPSKYKYLEKKEIIVVMARLVSHKGHKYIINAMREVVKMSPNSMLLIFSRGPLKEELMELVSKYNLNNNVLFMNFYDNPFQFLKIAKCFVLASFYEGFPNVLIEAMTCGVPVIATDSPGGSYEIVSDKYDFLSKTKCLKKCEYGYLIPSFRKDKYCDVISDNEKILARAITNILNNDDIYEHFHKKSLIRVKKYNKEKIINEWLDII